MTTWSVRLPWLVAGAAIALLAPFFVPRPATAVATLAPIVADPVVTAEHSPGLTTGATEARDPDGRLVAVVLVVSPRAGEPVWCRLRVAVLVTEAQADGGQPAVCLWVREESR